MLFQQEWEDLLFNMGLVFVAIAIHEHVLFPTMTVQIAEEEQLALGLHLLDQGLQMEDCWMLLCIGIDPDTIQITAREVTPSVSIDNAIWVDHRYDFYDKIVT